MAAGSTGGVIDHVDVTFDRAIDAATFTLADVTLTDPGAGPVTLTGLSDLGGNGYRITFDALASQEDRGQQLQRLRRELGIEQPILVGTRPAATLR